MFLAHELSPEESQHFYMAVCDFLTKPFEKKDLNFKNLSSARGRNNKPIEITKRSYLIPALFMRNWIAHGLFEAENTGPLSAKDTCFAFLITHFLSLVELNG